MQHLGQISASERGVAGARGGEASRSRDHKQRVACGALEGLGALPAPGPRMLAEPHAARMGPEENVSCVPRERGGSEARRKRCSQ